MTSIVKKFIRKRRKSSKNSKLSKDSEINVTGVDNWFETSQCKYYEYSDFKNIQSIRGSVRANLKNNEQFFSLKSFNNDEGTLCKVVNEVIFKLLLIKVLIKLKINLYLIL